MATQGRLKALYDFENKKVFFPDVHASFKFCVFVASPSPVSEPAKSAFYLHNVAEIDDPQRCFSLSAQDFTAVNPNTGTAPIFRSRRDAELTTAIYRRLPVLVDRSTGGEIKAWPVRHATMFHMANDSHLFRTREELEEQEGAYPVGNNHFDSPSGKWLPLYEGKMVQAFDHRAASVVVNPNNLHRPGQPVSSTSEQHRDPGWLPDPQFWVLYPQSSSVHRLQNDNRANEQPHLHCSLPATLRFRPTRWTFCCRRRTLRKISERLLLWYWEISTRSPSTL